MNKDDLSEIEAEFTKSWYSFEGYLQDGLDRHYAYLVSIVHFIHEIQSRRYDKVFRAEHEGELLIISRTRQANSSEGKPKITVNYRADEPLRMSLMLDGETTILELKPNHPIDEKVEALLELLKTQPIT